MPSPLAPVAPVTSPGVATPDPGVRPRLRILGFGTYDSAVHPRVRVLLDGLRARGHQVDEATVPLGLDTTWRVRILRRPWLLPVLAVRVGSAWARLWWKARRLGEFDAVVVGYLGHLDVHLARRRFPDSTIVLDHLVSLADTATDRGGASGGRGAALGRLDRLAVAAADVVVVDTDGHLGLLPSTGRERALVVAVGAPADWFREPVEHEDGRLRVVFFGLYTPLQGATVIARAISRLAGRPIRFSMCGRGQEWAAARSLADSNTAVEWHDWIEPAELPAFVAGHDVCLGIFGTGPKALRVVPNKLYQGAAAGCAIVTSDTGPQRTALGDAGTYVPAGDDEALAAAIDALAMDRQRLRDLRLAASRRAATTFRPEQVVAPLDARLAGLRD